MRFDSSLHRSALALVVAFSIAACTSEPSPTPQPALRYNAPPSAPNGQRTPPNGGKPKPPPPMHTMSADEAMSRIDADKDGVITYKEHMDFAAHEADQRFARMDRDHDGRLTKKELGAADEHRQSMKPNSSKPNGGKGHQPPGMESLIQRADTNHDGTVDLKEYRALTLQQAAQRFKAADKNGDGRLERGEMQMRPQGPGQ